jgi:hypothetical protein
MPASSRNNRISGLPRWAAVLLLAAAASSLSADIVSDIVARVPTSPRSFEQVMSALAALPATGRCKLTTLGRTPQGRPLVMAEVTDFQSTYPQSTLFIIGRQHGTEAAGSESALALLQHFAAAPTQLEQDILKYLRLVAVPVANPDGMAGHHRDNANGVDLNRDWGRLSQPETRLIEAAVRRERPNAILDLHELPAESSKAAYQENFLETTGTCEALSPTLCRRAQQISTALIGWLRTFGYPLHVYYDYPGDSFALCHRYFGLKQQYPTFLCEAKNGEGRTLPVRAGFHVVAALVVANYIMHDGLGPAPAAAGTGAPPPEGVRQAAAPQPEIKPPPPEPAEVHVNLEPAPAGGKQDARLHVRVQGGEDFSYVELSVGGRTRALSNLRDNTWPLDLGALPVGQYRLRVAAYDLRDQELASRELAVQVTGESVLAAQ